MEEETMISDTTAPPWAADASDRGAAAPSALLTYLVQSSEVSVSLASALLLLRRRSAVVPAFTDDKDVVMIDTEDSFFSKGGVCVCINVPLGPFVVCLFLSSLSECGLGSDDGSIGYGLNNDDRHLKCLPKGTQDRGGFDD